MNFDFFFILYCIAFIFFKGSHIIFKKSLLEGSSHNGGRGRNPSLPCTTKRSITTNLKSINNQKCQKIKLHGTLTTKELKKNSIRTTRLVRWLTKRACWLRKTTVRQQTAWVRLAALRQQTQAVAALGETPPLTLESVGKHAREEPVSYIVPSLAPSPAPSPHR